MATVRMNRHGNLVIDFTYKRKRHVYSTGFSDKKDNRKKAARIKGAIEHGISTNTLDLSKYFPRAANTPATKGTLGEFYEFFISEKTLKQNTMKSLSSIWNTHIEPYFGHFQWDKISTHEIKVFRAMLDKEKHLKASSINQIMTILNGIMIRAHEEGLLARNPFYRFRRLRADKAKLLPFSFDELREFLSFLKKSKPEYHEMVYIWASCGFRIGEILALKWTNLDYFNKTIYVERTLHDNGSEGTPKTESSQRHVMLRPEVIEAFQRQEKRSRLASEYIFPDPYTNTRYINAKAFRGRFKILMTLSGLRLRAPNQLRHTFATLHIAVGENVSWVSKMLGHSSVKMTLERYNQYIPNLTRDDGSAFEKALISHRNSDLSVTPVRK